MIFRRADLSLISFNVDGVTVKANQKYKLGEGDKLVEVPGKGKEYTEAMAPKGDK